MQTGNNSLVQAGILQGEVSNLMVLDQWQASLMRCMAELQLRQSAEAREAITGRWARAWGHHDAWVACLLWCGGRVGRLRRGFYFGTK